MSMEPTQPMSPPAADGSDPADEPAPEQPGAGHDDVPAPEQVAPTRVQPILQPKPAGRPAGSPQPSFTPAKPSFTPGAGGQGGQAAQPAQAQPGQVQPGQEAQPAQWAQPGQAAQPAQGVIPVQPAFQPSGLGPGAPGAPGAAQSFGQPGGQAVFDPGQGAWPEQPPQYTSQEGWPQPPYGGMPGGPQAGQGRLGYPVRPPRRRRRARRSVMLLFTVIVLAILATVGDRVANAIAENTIANQMVKNGFPVKPSVTIEGFPFLTQVISHDIHKIDISASNVPAGPVTITSVKGTLTGVHLNSSFNGGIVDHIVGTLFISFTSLANAGGGGVGTGITMTADGPDQVKISAGIGPLSDTEIAKVTQTGPSQITVQVENSGSALSGLLSSFGSYSFTIPKLPAGLKITKVSVTQTGIVVSAAGNHTQLSEPSS